MQTTHRRRSLLMVMLFTILTGCANGIPQASSVGTPSVPLPAAVSACPVTLPNGNSPPGERATSNYYGDGSLWVDLWPGGVVHARPTDVSPDGAITMKFPWWRAVQGALSIAGYRLDGSAPALWTNIPDGYGDSGFQATEIIFPTAGCWEVTGTVGAARLRFVTLVQRG
jgi:hypothetical protein